MPKETVNTINPYQESIYLPAEAEIEFSSRGERAEDLFIQMLEVNFGLPQVTPEEIKDKPSTSSFARSTEEEDYEKGIDLWIWNAEKDQLIPMDLTTATDEDILKTKENRSKKTGIRIFPISERDLLEINPNTTSLSQGDQKKLLEDIGGYFRETIIEIPNPKTNSGYHVQQAPVFSEKYKVDRDVRDLMTRRRTGGQKARGIN